MRATLGLSSIILDWHLGMALKFYINVVRGLKIKVRKFLGPIPTFVEVTGEKLVGLVEGAVLLGPLHPE